jgi:hypothetical protein
MGRDVCNKLITRININASIPIAQRFAVWIFV